MATIIGLDIKQNADLKMQPVFIQCTWIRAFLTPAAIKLNCILSYDRQQLSTANLKEPQDNFKGTNYNVGTIKRNEIGVLTGSYVIDEKKRVWLEMLLFYCNRRSIGWVRESDVWHALKGCEPNELDWPYIPYKPKADPEDPGAGDETKKSSLTAWLIAALGLLSAIK